MREELSEFEATLDNLESMGRFVSEFMKAAHLSDDHINNFEVSVDEHVSNLIEHRLSKPSWPYVNSDVS